MRPILTWLLVLLMASMLVGAALADCAALPMPCCSQHRNANCHEMCSAPLGSPSNVAMPQVAAEFQTVSTGTPVAFAPRSPVHALPAFIPSTENLLTRIHVLLI